MCAISPTEILAAVAQSIALKLAILGGGTAEAAEPDSAA